MAPTHTAVAAAVAVSRPDAELARKAAASIVQPHKIPEQIAGDLLERLRKVKLLRESRGLNHWEAFAPGYLQKILLRHEAKRRAAIERFFRSEREKAIARATAMLGNREHAEEIVGDTFLELVEGRTVPERFYRALWANLVNRWEKAQKEASTFVSIEKVVMSACRSGSAESGSECGAEAVEDFASTRLDDQDPLDILIAREREEARRQRVKKALEIARGCRKYRWVRAKNWARDLEIRVAA